MAKKHFFNGLLSVVTVTVPPLRERTEDIPVLVERHIRYLAQQVSRHVTGIDAQAMHAMCRYTWPGNVRELKNVIERAILLCDNTEITLNDLPESIAGTVAESQGAGPARDSAHHLRLPEPWLTKSLHEVREAFLSDLERQYIEGLLIATRGRIGETAKRAGIQERSLYDKMKQFGLRKEDFRPSRGDKA